MIALLAILLGGTYVVVLSRAAGRGPAAVWSTAGSALLFVALTGVVLGQYHAVPSIGRLVVHNVTLTGPAVLVPAAMLSFPPTRARPLIAVLTATAGLCVGAVGGLALAMFAFRVW